MPASQGDGPGRLVRPGLIAAGTAASYLLLASVSYAIPLLGTEIVAAWLPAGLLLAFLLLLDGSEWGAAMAGAVVGNMLADVHHGSRLLVALAAGFANVAESFVGALVLRQKLGRKISLGRLRELGWLLLGVVVATNAVTSLLGALVMHLAGSAAFNRSWITWWVGDGAGMLLITPLLLTFVDRTRGGEPVAWRSVVHGAVAVVALIVVAGFTLANPRGSGRFIGTSPYLVLPFVLWIALAFGPVGASVAAFGVGMAALGYGAAGHGPFVAPGESELKEVLGLYSFLALTTLTGLVPAAILEERRRATAALRSSEARFRELAGAIDDVFWIADHETLAPLYVSPAFERIWGRPGMAVTGGRDGLLDTVHPDDVAAVAATYAASRGGRPFEHTYRIVRPDGEVRWIHGRGFPVRDGAGAVVRIAGVARDITTQREAETALVRTEEQMRFALEASAVGFWEADLVGDTATWSATCEAMHGLEPGTFGGRLGAFIDLIHPEDREIIAQRVADSIAAHADAQIEYRTRWPDGTVHWIVSTIHPVHDADGRPLKATGVAIDVTERRELENQLRQAGKMEAVGQLAGGIAHDFNNILTAILGNAELLIEDASATVDQRNSAAEIRTAAVRGARLTRQLLAFGRRQVLMPRRTRVSEVVRDMLPMLRRVLGEHIIISAPDTTADPELVADVTQLEQIILNLAINAGDAMPDGGQLDITVGEALLPPDAGPREMPLDGGRYVVIDVTDSGTGIGREVLAHIFEPFFTTKPAGHGTGLGLATVHGIVTQMHGAVEVSSRRGEGTRFRIYLPAADETGERETESERQQVTVGGNETILLVEDEPAVRAYLTKTLERHGYRVIAAADAAAAQDAFRRAAVPIDVLITDLRMPGISGVDLAAELRKTQPVLRVIFMSGYSELAADIASSEQPFLAKPFSGADLAAMVRTVLDAGRIVN